MGRRTNSVVQAWRSAFRASSSPSIAFQLTADTREAVVAYGEQLKAEAEGFSTNFLLPLNDLIDGFNRALLSTPGESVQFKPEHTVERTSLARAPSRQRGHLSSSFPAGWTHGRSAVT